MTVGLTLHPAACSADDTAIASADPAIAFARLHALTAPAECPDEGGGDIVVCGRHSGDPERYRLPLRQDRFDPAGSAESVSRERNRLMEGGESGIGACSPAGAGGWTGCFIRDVRHRQQQYGYR